VGGGKQAIAEAYRNLCAVGATPLAATDCMNFGNPQRPEIMGQFVGCIEGMGEACRALDFPIVSGNVSLYNETKNEDGSGSAILPTPAIGGVGLLQDWRKSATIALNVGEHEAAQQVYLVSGRSQGDDRVGEHLGQSLWLREVLGREDGPPPSVDLDAERRAGEFIREIIDHGYVSAVHDISDGGLLVALAEMALAGNTGCDLHWPKFYTSETPLSGQLFGEDQGRYLIVGAYGDDRIRALAESRSVELTPLGITGGETIELEEIFEVPLDELRRAHEGFFPALMGGEPPAA
jgi:phosphoribosylformylglycinamidine synthase